MSVQSRQIAVPRPTGARVQRAVLLRRLESASEPLVLLVAPSGFGKTSLLAQWATTTEAQVAWLSCDESDGEPAQFWSRLTACLAARWPAMGSDAALIVERPSWDEQELVDSLDRDLADLPAPAAVVIDDAQFAEASLRTLARVAQRLPGHVRLLVASQHNPVFSTSRLRLAGVITELRADDLAFTQVEVEQLLELAGLGQEPIDGRRLRSLTEGWPAGLQMAVLAMRAGGDPREVIDAKRAACRLSCSARPRYSYRTGARVGEAHRMRVALLVQSDRHSHLCGVWGARARGMARTALIGPTMTACCGSTWRHCDGPMWPRFKQAARRRHWSGVGPDLTDMRILWIKVGPTQAVRVEPGQAVIARGLCSAPVCAIFKVLAVPEDVRSCWEVLDAAH